MGDKILKFIGVIFNNIIAWFFVAVACIIIYLFYHPEYVKDLIKILVPLLIYCLGLVISVKYRQTQKKRLEGNYGSSEETIVVNQVDFLKHDLLMFLTPLAILAAAYFLNGEVQKNDIISSAIALCGLYLSELIYKRKKAD